MSSILEALRKSDDKRQKESGKGVDQIQFSESKTVKKSRKGFYALVLLLLLVAATVWAYQEGYLNPIKDMFVTNDLPEEAIKADNKLEPVKKAAKKESGQEAGSKEQIVTALKPPEPKNIKEQIKKQGELESLAKAKNTLTQTGEDSEMDGTITVIEKKSNPTNLLVIDGKPAIEKSVKNEQSDSDTDFSKKLSATESAKLAKNSNEKSNKKLNKKEAQTDKQAYLLIHQLPFEIRKQMPELKINVHVFDPEPENRMVVINGVSFQVGDSIEDVATVQDIIVEGVVVEVAGTEFMIPK